MHNPEDLFKNSFDGYRQEPPPGVWDGINRRLTLRDFLRPSFRHFNIYYIAAIVTAATIWVSSGSDNAPKADNSSVQSTEAADISTNTTSGAQPTYHETENRRVSGGTLPKQSAEKEHTVLKSDTFATQPADSQAANTDTGVAATSSEAEIQRTSQTDSPMPYFTSAFHASQHQGCAPLSVQLHNLSQNTEYCQWNLGNGETSYEQDPSVTYDKPGTYIIALRTVSGTFAKTSYDTIKVSARQQVEIAVAISGMTIIAEARNVNGGNIVWDFGDKTQLMGKKHSHTYKQPGVYDIVLTISDDICTDTVTRRITIKEPEFSIAFPNAIIASRSGFSTGDYKSVSPENKALFGPKGDIDALSKYSLTIYTRAGKQVFHTNNPRDTWNGYYNDALMPRGVYVYKCQYEFVNGEASAVNGNITLLWE